MGRLAAEVRRLEDEISRRAAARSASSGSTPEDKLTARERVDRLVDAGGRFVEIGLLVATTSMTGRRRRAGVVTGVGEVHGREWS